MMESVALQTTFVISRVIHARERLSIAQVLKINAIQLFAWKRPDYVLKILFQIHNLVMMGYSVPWVILV
jgi:hypothetical protein